ncbi:MAG: xanthine dehydrogenase family protein subunit M [Candidatus Eisenbacteria bacterium]|nr:xanthine dehydrogenase family protein subunit M [Candidatus Eisenbacteria bacterium]
MIEILEYHAPAGIQEALKILSKTRGITIIAGGTDEIGRLKEERKPLSVLDISGIKSLRGVKITKTQIILGALTTHKTIEESRQLAKLCPSLVEAASMIGSPQIRSRGTVGGNIANASPAGDLIPPLITFDAKVVLASRSGRREVPLEKLLKGPGKTAISSKEILSSVVIDRRGLPPLQSFRKAGQRNSLAISLVNVAVGAHVEGGKIVKVRIALGSVAPTAIRAVAAEKVLLGRIPTRELVAKTSKVAAGESKPIDDVRGHAWYRKELIQVLVEDAFERILDLS